MKQKGTILNIVTIKDNWSGGAPITFDKDFPKLSLNSNINIFINKNKLFFLL